MDKSLPAALRQEFFIEKLLREKENNCIFLLRERGTNCRVVGRSCVGDAEVYRKLQNVRCDNLPKIERVHAEQNQVFVVEEYIPGDTLDFLLEEKPLPETYAKRIFLQLCTAVRALHGAGVVHRDIKPENVILRGDEAVLIDFDASRINKAERTTDTTVMGTAGYAAPEQFGFAQTDARADIYSLGVLLNVMLTRRHPSVVLAGGSMRNIIEKCTETNVDKRFSSVDALMKAVKKKRNWKWLLPVAVLCLVISAGSVGLFLSQRQVTEVPEALPAVVVQQSEKYTEPPVSQEPVEPVRVELPREDPPPEQMQEEKPAAEAVPDEPAEPVLLSAEVWTGESKFEMMEFQYDLDEDGTPEDYVFGPGFYIKDGVNPVYTDEFVVLGNTPRKVVPAVWRIRENGVLEIARDFSRLLNQPHVTVHPGQADMAGTPIVEECTLDVWSGGVHPMFTPDCIGSWVMHAEAELGDLKLSGTGTCFPKGH